MQLQKKSNRWQCLPVSFAMAMDINVENIFDEIGHNGEQILWPDLPEPMCRRGFHIQEMIKVALRRGYAVTPFELCPVLESQGRQYIFDERWAAFRDTIENSVGVLTGHGHRNGHAVAYSFGQIFDPDDCVYDYSRRACEDRFFYANCIWRVDRRLYVQP